jgi:hypothetical protein
MNLPVRPARQQLNPVPATHPNSLAVLNTVTNPVRGFSEFTTIDGNAIQTEILRAQTLNLNAATLQADCDALGVYADQLVLIAQQSEQLRAQAVEQLGETEKRLEQVQATLEKERAQHRAEIEEAHQAQKELLDQIEQLKAGQLKAEDGRLTAGEYAAALHFKEAVLAAQAAAPAALAAPPVSGAAVAWTEQEDTDWTQHEEASEDGW